MRGSGRDGRDLMERSARSGAQDARLSDRGEPTQGVSGMRTPEGGVTVINYPIPDSTLKGHFFRTAAVVAEECGFARLLKLYSDWSD